MLESEGAIEVSLCKSRCVQECGSLKKPLEEGVVLLPDRKIVGLNYKRAKECGSLKKPKAKGVVLLPDRKIVGLNYKRAKEW
jgi:hypothetical protein